MPVPLSQLVRVNKLLVQAEREYTPAAFARALAALEDIEDQEDDEVKFRRTTIRHAFAEFRGDAAMLREVIAEYERIVAKGGLHPELADLMPELIADCRRQLQDADAGRHGWVK